MRSVTKHSFSSFFVYISLITINYKLMSRMKSNKNIFINQLLIKNMILKTKKNNEKCHLIKFLSTLIYFLSGRPII